VPSAGARADTIAWRLWLAEGSRIPRKGGTNSLHQEHSSMQYANRQRRPIVAE
jgi:hypothetical protein